MFRGDSAEKNRATYGLSEQFDETLRMSQSTIASLDSAKPTPDIHPYLEIGKSLQNLRRSVFDMYKDEVNKSVRSTDRNSPPLATYHSTTTSTNQYYESTFESNNRDTHRSSVILTPSAIADSSRNSSTQKSVSHRASNAHEDHRSTPQDESRHSKNRNSTPYRQTTREYDDVGQIPHFTTADLNDSGEDSTSDRRTTHNHHGARGSSTRAQADTQKRIMRSGSESLSDAVSPQRRRFHSRSHTEQVDDASRDSQDTDSSRDEHKGRDKVPASASASAEVSHSIALIVGQHEEKFTNLTKAIDFWQRKSTALESQLASHDQSYNSKLEYVLAEQENLSGQQQQVLKELSAALAAHQAALAAATAAGGSPSGAETSKQTPFSPELIQGGDALLKESIQKLDTLIRLTTEISTNATPMKSPPFLPGGVTATPQSEARRHTHTEGLATVYAARGELLSTPQGVHGQVQGGGSPPEQLSPAQQQLISFQNMQHRQEEMDQMQRLYDNLSQQLRRLFEEKSVLLEEIAEARNVNFDLQQKLRLEGTAHQQAMVEMREEFESQVRAARHLTQEAKEQANQSRAAEKKLQDIERELNMRIADLETQLSSRVLELTSVRASLSKAQVRINTLQEELNSTKSSGEDHEVAYLEAQRKLKEMNKTTFSKDELIVSLQKEVQDLQNKIKKPFTTSVKNIENTEKRINYDYEVAMLKDSVLAIQESEAELQKEYLNLQAESKKELKRVKDASSQEVAKINAEHEAELENLRKELHQRKRHIEQQTRLRTLAEEELNELRITYTKLEEAHSHYRVENGELTHGNEQARNLTEELKDQLSAKQTEISKILAQLTRARKRIEKLEAVVDEKEKSLSELNTHQKRLQLSIRTHAEREIDHLQALRQIMQDSTLRITSGPHSAPSTPAADNIHTLLLKNSSSPSSNSSSPTTGARAGNGLLPLSVKGRKLSLPALEAECDALWEDIPNAVETVMNELKQYHGRTASLSSDLQMSRVSSTTMNTELTTHISRQQAEILSLKHEIETRDLNAKKRLEKFKAASTAEFTTQTERLKTELVALNGQIETLATEKADQVGRLKAERSAVQGELENTQHQLNELNRRCHTLQDQQTSSEKRFRVAALELVQDIQALSSLVLDTNISGLSALSKSQSRTGTPTHASPSHAKASQLPMADSDLPADQVLATAAVLLRSKSKELAKFLKNVKRVDTQQQDALRTFFDSLNASFVSVTQSHRAHLLHDQLQLFGAPDTPIKTSSTIARSDHSHLYQYLCGEDAELSEMLRSLEDNIYTTLQRANSVETHLIHQKRELNDLQDQLAEAQKETAHESSQKDALQQRVTRLEGSLQSQMVEFTSTAEAVHEKELQLTRQRDLLELDLNEIEEKFQVVAQRNEHLEQNVANLEDEIHGSQQELRDARRTLDEVFAQLQASQGKLGDLQQELRGAALDKENLSQRLLQAQAEHEATQQLLVDVQNEHAQQIADLQALHDQHVTDILNKHSQQADQVSKLRGTIAERNDHHFHLETEHGRVKLQLAQAEEDNAFVYAELQETKAQLVECQDQLATTREQLEAKLEEIMHSQSQISELCGEVQTQSTTLTQETTQLRVVREQLSQNCTTLATLQINHTTLQKEYDVVVAKVEIHQERAFSLEAQIQENSEFIDTLRGKIIELEEHSEQAQHAYEALSGSNSDLREQVVELNAQLVEFQTLDAEFHEVQDELARVKEAHEEELTLIKQEQIEELTSRRVEFEEQLAQTKEAFEVEIARQKEELQGVLDAHNEDVTQYERALQDGAARVKQLEEEQEILSEKLIALANEAALWPAREEELEANIAVSHGQIKALTEQLAEAEDQLKMVSEKAKEEQERLTAEVETTQKLLVEQTEEQLEKFAEQNRTLSKREAALAEALARVTELEDQLADIERQVIVTSESLVTVEGTRGQLEQQCDHLSNELQDSKQHLADLQGHMKQQELALMESAKHESASKLALRALESERATLRERLDTATASCTDLQIELAEKSTTLKIQMELKTELVDERDRLRASLEAADDESHRANMQVERYKQKLEEVTKEVNFLRSGVDKKDHTFNTQRNMIRDLRDSNDALETTIKELKTQNDALELSLLKTREVEAELESTRKQLLASTQENDQLKHNAYQLTATRRELESTTRELQGKTELESAYRENRVELELALRQVESAHRELSSRTHTVEALQREVDTSAASVRTLTSELSISKTDLSSTRAELKSAADLLQSTKSSLESVVSQFTATKEDLSSTRRELDIVSKELAGRNSTIEQFGKIRGDLDHRVLVLESENRDLTSKVHGLELDKSAQYDRSTEALERERLKAEAKAEQLQERQSALVLQLETAKTEASAHRRSWDETHAKLIVADGQVESLRSQLGSAQQENSTLKMDLGMSTREVKHLEEQIHELQGHRAESDALRVMVADLQRQLQQHGSDRQLTESRETSFKNQEIATLRKELDEMRVQVAETNKYKVQVDTLERTAASATREVTELKVENERLQSRIKTTQMDYELSQRQFQFNNLMMAGGMGMNQGVVVARAAPPPPQYHHPDYYEPPRRSERDDRLTSAMENITSLLREKEVAAVQAASTQQALEMNVLQLAEEKHKNTALTDANSKLETKVDKLRDKLEETTAQRIADEQKLLTLRDEVGSLNTQLQIKSHDLIIKNQDVEKLAAAKEALEKRLTEELKQLQEKWLKAQGEHQKELHVNQTLAVQVEDARREKTTADERHRNEQIFAQKALETSRAETAAAQDQLLQVKAQGVHDKEKVAVLSSKVTELTARLGQAESRAELSAEEAHKLTTVNTALSTANAGLSGKLSAAAQQCKEWEHKSEQLQSKTDQLQAKYEQQTSKCDSLQAKLDALAKEILHALSIVDSSSSKRAFRVDSAQSVDYLVANLTTEISKYHSIHTEVTERRGEASKLENSLQTLSKQEAVQKSQLLSITTELTTTTTQLHETRSQLSVLQQSHRETEAQIASLKSVNSELEFMCDTVTKELKAAMHRAEELETAKADQRSELNKQLETLRSDAEHRLQRELAPLERQVHDLTERLAGAEKTSHGLQTDSLKSRADFVKAQQDIESLTAIAHSLYKQVTAVNAPSSPSKAAHNVPDSYKLTSASAMLSAVESTVVEWSRNLSDLRTNAAIQADAIAMKNKLVDELQARVQQCALETQDSLHNVLVEVNKLARVASVAAQPTSPVRTPTRGARSPPNSARGERSLSFSSTVSDASRSDSAATLYQKIVRTLDTLQAHYDRTVQAQNAECDKLRARLAMKESEFESAVSIQTSSLNLQRSRQEEEQAQREREILQLKLLQEQQHDQHLQQLQVFQESVHVQHSEQIALVKQTHSAQLAQCEQQLRHAQKALNRSLRERTVLQETLDQLRDEFKLREQDVEELGAQTASSQEYFATTQQRYQTQIAQLEAQVEQLRHTASVAQSHSSSKKEVFYFENEVLTSDQVREKLQELVQYRDYTEQKILDFEHLIMNTFYHKAEDGASGAARRFKSPQQAQFEFEEEEEEDRERELRRHAMEARGEEPYPLEPTSPVWRTHTEAQSARIRRLSSGSGSFSTPSKSATGGLLSGMLLDFHQVLKEHRRLKRLCSSQQVCIMALRLVMKESEAVVVHTEHKESF